MFLPDSWKELPEIAPQWLWLAFLSIGLALSLIPLLACVKIYRRIKRAQRVVLYSGILVSLGSGSFIFSCRPVVAHCWQWTLDKFANLPTVSEAGSSLTNTLVPLLANFCGVGLLLFILYIVLEEF